MSRWAVDCSIEFETGDELKDAINTAHCLAAALEWSPAGKDTKVKVVLSENYEKEEEGRYVKQNSKRR